MGNKYRAEQYISISASESGTEIELQMVVDFTVHPGSPATMIDPPEGPLAEIDQVQFFMVKDGKPLPNVTASMPDWLEDHFTTGDDFQTWMLTEADEQYIAAKEDAADHRREMMREERL